MPPDTGSMFVENAGGAAQCSPYIFGGFIMHISGMVSTWNLAKTIFAGPVTFAPS
jgi:hypothetical protein